ncbi:hypothetical protein Sjap_025679 [Stephania japonica]|uniref:Uncharacterized protein n=1 Tax=Stephania japonica TaxID=461633 RepID=A0AAP0E9X5_9MAGN
MEQFAHVVLNNTTQAYPSFLIEESCVSIAFEQIHCRRTPLFLMTANNFLGCPSPTIPLRLSLHHKSFHALPNNHMYPPSPGRAGKINH